MESREANRERDDQLDAQIDQLLTSNSPDGHAGQNEEKVAAEFVRLAAEESPRMSAGARTQGLNALRARAAEKRRKQRPNPLAWFGAFPRWAQVAAVAIVVVLIVNGVTNAAADSLPGSLLYPFKRVTEGGQLLLQYSNGQRAQWWMNLANTRLDEVQRLLESGKTAAPGSLDAVDDSILRALTEIAGTHGNERVQLLKQLTLLAIREQQIVDQLAQSATPQDRARLEQTAKLLAGVANYATSGAAIAGPEINPIQALTPSATAPQLTPRPTLTLMPTPTLLPTELPSATIQGSQTFFGARGTPVEGGAGGGSGSPTPARTEDRGHDATETRGPTDDHGHDGTGTPHPTDDPGHGGSATPPSTDDHGHGGTVTPPSTDDDGHHGTSTPPSTDDHGHGGTVTPPSTDDHGHGGTETREPTDAPEPSETHEPTDAPEPSKTHEPTNAPEPSNTHEPTQVRPPTETNEPQKTNEPTDVRPPTKTHEPEKTDAPEKTKEPTQAPKPTKTPHSGKVIPQILSFTSILFLLLSV